MSRDTEPLFKWGRLPVYLTTIFVALLTLGFFISAALMSAKSPWLQSLRFNTPVGSWSGWFSAFTYPLVQPVDFFTPLSIVCFYWWALGIESHLGRAPLIRLLGILVLLPVAFMSLLSVTGIGYGELSGQYFITAGLLVAFATLYPNTEWAGWVPFKYLAFACILCGSLMFVAQQNWLGAADLWLVCIATFFFMRHAIEQEHDDYVPLGARVRSWFQRKPKFRVVPRTRNTFSSSSREDDADDELESEMDALLDKIAKNGLSSLSSNERARLELAREQLLKKERK